MKKDNMYYAYLWTLVSTLNTALYCLMEMLCYHPNDRVGRKLMNLRLLIKNFLKGTQKGMDKETKEEMDRLTHENVAAMAETIALIAALDEKDIDPFCKRVNDMIVEITKDKIAAKNKQ